MSNIVNNNRHNGVKRSSKKEPPAVLTTIHTTMIEVETLEREIILIEEEDNQEEERINPKKKNRINPSARYEKMNASAKVDEIEDRGFEDRARLPFTPPNANNNNSATQQETANIVTPGTGSITKSGESKEENEGVFLFKEKVRRSLSMPLPTVSVTSESFSCSVPLLDESSSSSRSSSDAEDVYDVEMTKNNESIIGREKSCFSSTILIPPKVSKIYSIISMKTGFIGGNGSGGAIYGELTMGSMQKIVNLMKEHTGFNKNSRFIDVGCGLAKPSLHVVQDPGVDFSFGIEMEKNRWLLGMHNLNHVLDEAKRINREVDKEGEKIGYQCFLKHGDVTEAKTFDPFTHVYMFDIGFPPFLFSRLSEMFNKSKTSYLICYHGPKIIIEKHKFGVEFVAQTSTSMHGSSESHMGYIYRRHKSSNIYEEKNSSEDIIPGNVPCDPLFKEPWREVQNGLDPLIELVKQQIDSHLDAKPPKRIIRLPLRYLD